MDPKDNHPTMRICLLTDCSPWWMKWRRSFCTLRLFPDVCKNLGPIVCFSATLVVMVLYAMADHLQSFVAGVFIPQYHYPFAVQITFVQVLSQKRITPLLMVIGPGQSISSKVSTALDEMCRVSQELPYSDYLYTEMTIKQVLVTLICLLLLNAVGLAPLKPYSLSLGERLLVPSVCGSAQALLGVWADAIAHSGMYPITMVLLPMLCVCWSRGMHLAVPTSIRLTGLITVITVASVGITASQGLPKAELLECLYSAMALVFHSMSLTWLAKVAETERHSSGHVAPFDLYYTLIVNQSLVLGFLCLLHPDSPRALGDGSWHSLLFMGYLLIILLLGALQHFLVDMAAIVISPLAAALLYTARRLTTPFYSIL